jgi:uncharacterized delta-60 repeat protein
METRPLAFALFSIVLASCGGGGSSEDPAQNRAPVANAGADFDIARNTLIMLDGSTSSDADNDTLSYSWSRIASPNGSSAALSDTSSATPSITADELGDYTLQLVVNDGEIDSAADTIVLSAINSAPVAVLDVIRPGTGEVNKIIDVDASNSSDLDNDTLIFSWTILSAPAGSTAAMSEPDAGGAYFTPDVAGDYTVELTVSDGVLEDSAEVTVTAANTPPVANFKVGLGQYSNAVGATINLYAGESFDANGDTLTFDWSIIASPVGSLASVELPDPTQSGQATLTLDKEGEYTIQLIANDGFSDSDPVTDSVTAAALNLPPIANAGSDRSTAVGKLFTLDGSHSADPDGIFYLTYDWQLISQPAGSSASLTDSTTVSPAFTPDLAGDYEIQLIVRDYAQISQADSVIISAFDETTQPVAVAGDDVVASQFDTISLDASASYDPDSSGSLSYSWTIDSAPAGSSASFDNASSATPAIQIDVTGDYMISLSVSDGSETSPADSLKLTVQENIGQIDTAYGSNGMANSGNDVTQGQTFNADAMAIDAAGNIYLAGSQFIGDFSTGAYKMAIWKFDSSGQLDTSFNSSGILIYSTAYTSRSDGIAIDGAGNLYVAGQARAASSSDPVQLALWKFDANGNADSGFGNNGVVLHTLASGGSTSDIGLAVAIDSNGKIYVTGSSYDGTGTAMALCRFNTDGSLDTTFNGSGAATSISSFGANTGRDLMLGSNGKIYVGGIYRSENQHYDAAIWSFNNDGSADTGFNSTGLMTINLSQESGRELDSIYALALDSQNNILIGGYTVGLNDDAVIFKYKPDGTLDTSFNGKGYVIFNSRIIGTNGDISNKDQIKDIVIDDQDNIYATGNSGSTNYYGLWKFNANGVMDKSFNYSGFASERLINGFKTFSPAGIALDAQNKVYFSGSAYADNGTNTQHRDVFIIKYK